MTIQSNSESENFAKGLLETGKLSAAPLDLFEKGHRLRILRFIALKKDVEGTFGQKELNALIAVLAPQKAFFAKFSGESPYPNATRRLPHGTSSF